MSSDDELVQVCECRGDLEAQSIRAALHARGIYANIVGENMHGTFGGISATMAQPRIFVRREDWETARVLAEEIGGPFDESTSVAEDEDGAEDPYRNDPDGEAYGDEDIEEEEEDDDDDDDADAAKPNVKSAVVPFIFLITGLAMGLGHMYAGKKGTGTGLFLASMLLLPSALLAGSEIGFLLLVGVWLIDVTGSLRAIEAHNQGVERRALEGS